MCSRSALPVASCTMVSSPGPIVSTSVVQLAAAAAVAVVVSIPILLASTETELDWARYTCAGIIGAVGYFAARGAEHGRIRAVLFGFGVLAIAIVIAVLKHRLAGR
jgi:hypothetical protein